jgi:hypothetical protein
VVDTAPRWTQCPELVEGTGAFGAVEVSKNLNPLKQFGEEIGDEERIGKDQCPTGYSFKTKLNSAPLFCFLNS